MDVSNNPILLELALVLGIATALHVALGPIVARMVEALKPSGLVRDCQAGVAAILIGAAIGGLMGFLAYANPEASGHNDWRFIAYGVIAGVLGPGSGAVTSAQVRTGIETSKAMRMAERFAGDATADRVTTDWHGTPAQQPYRTTDEIVPAEDTIDGVDPVLWSYKQEERRLAETGDTGPFGTIEIPDLGTVDHAEYYGWKPRPHPVV